MSSGELAKSSADNGEQINRQDNRQIGEYVLDAFDKSSEASIRSEFDEQFKDSKTVRDAFGRIPANQTDFLMGVPYASHEEEGFSGDAASLFALVKFQKNGPKIELVKIGWGEFSKQTFTKGAKSRYSSSVPKYKNGEYYGYVAEHEVLRNLPFDVYCVRQHESYLADEETQYDMCYHPEKYLKEHALFVANNGNVTMASKIKADYPMIKGNHKLDHDIAPIAEEDILNSIDKMRDLYNETIKKLSKNN